MELRPLQERAPIRRGVPRTMAIAGAFIGDAALEKMVGDKIVVACPSEHENERHPLGN
jgi:hypothetical protein